MDLGGGALQTLAFALAPVSLLQPISGIGLAGLALYSHFVANEKIKSDEWIAVGIAGLGTLGLATSSSDAQAPHHHSVSFLRMMTVLTATGIFVISKMTHIREHRVPRNNKKLTAAMYGLQAGGMFGLSASTVRTGFIMSSHRWTWAPFGVICGASCGTRTLNDANENLPRDLTPPLHPLALARRPHVLLRLRPADRRTERRLGRDRVHLPGRQQHVHRWVLNSTDVRPPSLTRAMRHARPPGVFTGICGRY